MTTPDEWCDDWEAAEMVDAALLELASINLAFGLTGMLTFFGGECSDCGMWTACATFDDNLRLCWSCHTDFVEWAKTQ